MKNHRLSHQVLLLQQLEAKFSWKFFPFSLPQPMFFVCLFFLFLSALSLCTVLCHWCHAEGVLCHLLLCVYFRHVDPFSFLLRLSPSMRQHSLKQCVYKVEKRGLFGVFLLDQKSLPCEVYKCIHSLILCENILRMIGWFLTSMLK